MLYRLMRSMMLSAEVAAEQARRVRLLGSLVDEVRRFEELSKTPMQDDEEMFLQTKALIEGIAEVAKIVGKIEANVERFARERVCDVVDQEMRLNELVDEHSQLKREVKNARLLSKSIASRIGAIKSKRFSPLWEVIWGMTDKSVNCQKLCNMKEFKRLAFDVLSRAESKDSVVSSLGILANVSNWAFGVREIAKMIDECECRFFEKLIELNYRFGEDRVKQLTLYLIRNLTSDEDMCFACLRENVLDFLLWRFDDFCQETEVRALATILNRLTQPQFSKTLEFHFSHSMDKLLAKLTPNEFALARSRLTPFAHSDPVPNTVQRFGVTRISSRT